MTRAKLYALTNSAIRVRLWHRPLTFGWLMIRRTHVNFPVIHNIASYVYFHFDVFIFRTSLRAGCKTASNQSFLRVVYCNHLLKIL